LKIRFLHSKREGGVDAREPPNARVHPAGCKDPLPAFSFFSLSNPVSVFHSATRFRLYLANRLHGGGGTMKKPSDCRRWHIEPCGECRGGHASL
jgi:hypothetical protein